MNGKEKIEEVLSHLGVKAPTLAANVGLKYQRILDIQIGKTKKISGEVANAIILQYPEFDINWLLTGEGEMLKSGRTVMVVDSENDKLIPLLPTAAQGGSLNDFIMSVNGRDCERVVSPIADVDFAMPIAGDSMAPEYPAGSQILVKKINEKAFIDWGRVYVLDTCNGAVIKILIPSEKDGHVKCQSINPDPKYAPFEVAYSDIFGIYRVLLCMAIK